MFFDLLYTTQLLVTLVGVAAAITTLIGAVRSGLLRTIRTGAIQEATPEEKRRAHEIARAVAPEGEPISYETEQLALYYGQVLNQSKASFWFSLVFASVGFLILIIAIFMYSENSQGATVVQLVAATVIDGVSALFFVQSKAAQKAMAEFFDKLRRDRNDLESRKLCDAVESPEARDALRVQLSLHYADVSDAAGVGAAIIQATTAKRAD